jgi:hypothetical protein
MCIICLRNQARISIPNSGALASRNDQPQPPTSEDIKRVRVIAPDYGITILSPK